MRQRGTNICLCHGVCERENEGEREKRTNVHVSNCVREKRETTDGQTERYGGR